MYQSGLQCDCFQWISSTLEGRLFLPDPEVIQSDINDAYSPQSAGPYVSSSLMSPQLLWPSHFRSGHTKWPLEHSKEPFAPEPTIEDKEFLLKYKCGHSRTFYFHRAILFGAQHNSIRNHLRTNCAEHIVTVAG